MKRLLVLLALALVAPCMALRAQCDLPCILVVVEMPVGEALGLTAHVTPLDEGVDGAGLDSAILGLIGDLSPINRDNLARELLGLDPRPTRLLPAILGLRRWGPLRCDGDTTGGLVEVDL